MSHEPQPLEGIVITPEEPAMPRRDPHPIRTWAALAVAGALILTGIAQGLPEGWDACLLCLGARP